MIEKPGRLMLIGLILMLVGFFLSLLMTLRWIESTFLLNFLAFGASTLGLFLGMIGLSFYMRMKR